jgi:hypothetical protein
MNTIRNDRANERDTHRYEREQTNERILSIVRIYLSFVEQESMIDVIEQVEQAVGACLSLNVACIHCNKHRHDSFV